MYVSTQEMGSKRTMRQWLGEMPLWEQMEVFFASALCKNASLGF